MSAWIPEDLGKQLVQQMLDGLEADNRKWDILQGRDPDNLPTTLVEQPYTSEWLDGRAGFATRWEAMISEGLRQGWLEVLSNGEEAAEYGITTGASRWVEAPNPDYDPTKPNPYVLPREGSITIPIVRTERG